MNVSSLSLTVPLPSTPPYPAPQVLGPELSDMLLHKPRLRLMLAPQPLLRADARHRQHLYPLAQVIRERPRSQDEKWELDEATQQVRLT